MQRERTCWFLILLGMVLTSSTELVKDMGVPIFPGGQSRPEVARAVQAYYRPGIARTETLTASVYETPAPFQKVFEFYAPLMDTGRWGWRRRVRTVLQQTETLKFLRSQLQAKQTKETYRLQDLKPLLGDLGVHPGEFSRRLDTLVRENWWVKIQVAEGTQTISGDPARSRLRVMIERPYLDADKMLLVDNTRVILIKVSRKGIRESP